MENQNLNADINSAPSAQVNSQINSPINEKPAIPIRESVFAWIAFALGFVFTHFCVNYFGGVWGGILWAAVGVFIAVYAKMNGIGFTKTNAVMLCVSEVFCLTPLFSANRFVCFLAAVFSFALYLYLMIVVSGADAFGRRFVTDFFLSIFYRPFESFARQPVSAFSVFKGKKRAKNFLYALAGLAISIPLTVVVVILLASSDDTFDGLLNGVFEKLPEFSFSIVWELLFAVPIAMYLFGAAYSMRKPAPAYSEETGKAPAYRFLPSVIAYFTVSPICVFYLIYTIVQIGNIANALGRNIGYSEFARQGFFQLCAIAVIDLFVIIALQMFSKRRENDAKPLALRVYTIVLCAFTLMIIATALIKMFMYINEYGMTSLRVYTSWFMILLAIVFILIAALQIREYPIWKALFAAFTLMFAVLCFGNFDGNIAAYNIKAYQSGAIERLDVDQFDELGVAAVAPAYKLYRECDDEELSHELKDFIESEQKYDEGNRRFAYFSVPRAAAWNAFEKMKLGGETEFFWVTVRIGDAEGVLGVTAEYQLGGKPQGGEEIMNADGDAFERGDELRFRLERRSFENFDELRDKNFAIYFRIRSKNSEYELAPNIPEHWANASESYDGAQYTLSQGEYEDGSFAEPVWEWRAAPGGEYEFILHENKIGWYDLYPVH